LKLRLFFFLVTISSEETVCFIDLDQDLNPSHKSKTLQSLRTRSGYRGHQPNNPFN